MYRILLSLVVSASLALSSCGLTPAEAGFGGAALGAGTGAAFGSLISNGDIAKSAGLGAAIGFPAGIVLSLAADSIWSYRTAEKDYSSEITEKQEKIVENNARIEEFRRQADREIPSDNPSSYKRGKIYDGPTYGNMYR